jgi:hypothetical protein
VLAVEPSVDCEPPSLVEAVVESELHAATTANDEANETTKTSLENRMKNTPWLAYLYSATMQEAKNLGARNPPRRAAWVARVVTGKPNPRRGSGGRACQKKLPMVNSNT